MPEQPDSGAGRPFALPSISGPVSGSGEGEYLGVTVYETSGTTAATLILYDGSTASGPILEAVKLAAAGSVSLNYPRPAREVTTGLYAQITGSVAGSVFQ